MQGQVDTMASERVNGAKVRRSRSARAGILFPVSRVHRELRGGRYADRIADTSAVYTAAVLEYLAAEVLEQAGDAAKAGGKTRITPRCIKLAVANDEELDQLFKGVTIPHGGVLPNIHRSLLAEKSPPASDNKVNKKGLLEEKNGGK